VLFYVCIFSTFFIFSFYFFILIYFAFVGIREELRKWFLSMETALFRYRFGFGSAEAQVGSAYSI
jgi:hypothetical protein